MMYDEDTISLGDEEPITHEPFAHIVQSLTLVKVGHTTCTFAYKNGTSWHWPKHCKPRSGGHLSRMAKPGLASVWYYDGTTTVS